jgi:1-phosphatidylinositol-3-phosphate 5-kinase
MASTNHKPLPSIPRRAEVSQTLTNLTIEGREHLGRLILSALAEEDQPFLSDGGRESWAYALESALDVLSDNLARGGWLAGLKRARMARKAKRVDVSKKSGVNNVKKELEDAGKSSGKEKGGISEGAPLRHDKELPKKPSSLATEQQADASDLALQQILDLAARPAIPTPKPSAKHLLLCLLPVQTEDSGFDLVPHDMGCTFSPGLFPLPDSDKAETGILFGLDEWDGLYFTYPPLLAILTITCLSQPVSFGQ